jgi:hypothetical protein
MRPKRLGRMAQRRFEQGQRAARRVARAGQNARRAPRAAHRARRRAVRRSGCLGRILLLF